MKAERRTMAPGTARKPASRKRFSPQPSNFDGTLSHHDALPGPPEIAPMSLRRNDSSTAFFSHWLTLHLPLGLALGDARLALVEEIERVIDRLAHLALGRGRDAVAGIERGVDRGFEGGQRHRDFLGNFAGPRGALSGFGVGTQDALTVVPDKGRQNRSRAGTHMWTAPVAQELLW